MEEARMDMFRDAVIKLANTYPNKPLSETQNNIIRDRFNRLFSAQQPPDHPPYAWMIERAIRELNEEGGSTEESISNFIRKEYDDLPWSHFTLLNHHLQELCKCGNIVLTHGQHYLLVGADSNLKLRTKCKRKQKRKKRDWDWHIKRRKLRKKDIGGEILLQEKDVHEKQKCIIEELNQQNMEADVRKDTRELCIVGEGGEQMEGDQTEISVPERPPGFDIERLKESSHLPLCCTENPSQGTHPMRNPTEVMSSVAEGVSGHQEQIHVFNVYDQWNCEEEQMILSKHETRVPSSIKTLEDVQPMTRNNGIDLQQTKNKEDPAMASQEGSIEHCSQKKPLVSELTENTAAISESEPVNLAARKQVRRIVFTYRKRPPIIRVAKQKDVSLTIQEREELLQEGQVKCQGQKHLLDNNATASSLQELGLSNPKEQQKMKSGEANKSEHVQPSCEGQQHPQGITEISDGSPSVSSLLQHQLKEHRISDTKEPQEGKSGTANRSKHQELLIPAAKPSYEESLQLEALNGAPEGPAISSDLPICSKQPNGGGAHEFSLVPIPRPFELETMDIKESIPTPRAQRQRNRWRRRLSNVKRPQLEDRTLVDSSQLTGDRVNLSSPGKKNAGKQRGVLALSVDSEEADCQELSRLAKLGKHPEVEPQTQTPKHQPNRPVSQEKPLGRVLRPRPLKPGQMKVVTTADFSLSKHQHDVQNQPKYNLRRRPLKAKPYKRSKNDKVVSLSSPKPHLGQQSGNPKCRLRERSLKCKQ